MRLTFAPAMLKSFVGGTFYWLIQNYHSASSSALPFFIIIIIIIMMIIMIMIIMIKIIMMIIMLIMMIRMNLIIKGRVAEVDASATSYDPHQQQHHMIRIIMITILSQ